MIQLDWQTVLYLTVAFAGWCTLFFLAAFKPEKRPVKRGSEYWKHAVQKQAKR